MPGPDSEKDRIAFPAGQVRTKLKAAVLASLATTKGPQVNPLSGAAKSPSAPSAAGVGEIPEAAETADTPVTHENPLLVPRRHKATAAESESKLIIVDVKPERLLSGAVDVPVADFTVAYEQAFTGVVPASGREPRSSWTPLLDAFKDGEFLLEKVMADCDISTTDPEETLLCLRLLMDIQLGLRNMVALPKDLIDLISLKANFEKLINLQQILKNRELAFSEATLTRQLALTHLCLGAVASILNTVKEKFPTVLPPTPSTSPDAVVASIQRGYASSSALRVLRSKVVAGAGIASPPATRVLTKETTVPPLLEKLSQIAFDYLKDNRASPALLAKFSNPKWIYTPLGYKDDKECLEMLVEITNDLRRTTASPLEIHVHKFLAMCMVPGLSYAFLKVNAPNPYSPEQLHSVAVETDNILDSRPMPSFKPGVSTANSTTAATPTARATPLGTMTPAATSPVRTPSGTRTPAATSPVETPSGTRTPAATSPVETPSGTRTPAATSPVETPSRTRTPAATSPVGTSSGTRTPAATSPVETPSGTRTPLASNGPTCASERGKWFAELLNITESEGLGITIETESGMLVAGSTSKEKSDFLSVIYGAYNNKAPSFLYYLLRLRIGGAHTVNVGGGFDQTNGGLTINLGMTNYYGPFNVLMVRHLINNQLVATTLRTPHSTFIHSVKSVDRRGNLKFVGSSIDDGETTYNTMYGRVNATTALINRFSISNATSEGTSITTTSSNYTVVGGSANILGVKHGYLAMLDTQDNLFWGQAIRACNQTLSVESLPDGRDSTAFMCEGPTSGAIVGVTFSNGTIKWLQAMTTTGTIKGKTLTATSDRLIIGGELNSALFVANLGLNGTFLGANFFNITGAGVGSSTLTPDGGLVQTGDVRLDGQNTTMALIKTQLDGGFPFSHPLSSPLELTMTPADLTVTDLTSDITVTELETTPDNSIPYIRLDITDDGLRAPLPSREQLFTCDFSRRLGDNKGALFEAAPLAYSHGFFRPEPLARLLPSSSNTPLGINVLLAAFTIAPSAFTIAPLLLCICGILWALRRGMTAKPVPGRKPTEESYPHGPANV
jgi:hypothetical protein